MPCPAGYQGLGAASFRPPVEVVISLICIFLSNVRTIAV